MELNIRLVANQPSDWRSNATKLRAFANLLDATPDQLELPLGAKVKASAVEEEETSEIDVSTMKGTTGKKATKRAKKVEAEEEEIQTASDDLPNPEDWEEEEETEEVETASDDSEEEWEEEEKPVAKKTATKKTKTITRDELRAAFRNFATDKTRWKGDAAKGRSAAVKVLAKFNAKNVNDLDESNFEAVMKLLA